MRRTVAAIPEHGEIKAQPAKLLHVASGKVVPKFRSRRTDTKSAMHLISFCSRLQVY